MQQLKTQPNLLTVTNMKDDNTISIRRVEPIRYESFDLLDNLSVIKIGIDIIKERTGNMLDKKTQSQFARIDEEITKMTEHLLELGSQ